MVGGGAQEDPMSFINMEPPRDKDVSFMGLALFLRSKWDHSWYHVRQQHFYLRKINFKYSILVGI